MARSKYKKWITKDGLIRIESWARDGLNNEQIAKNMGISPKTIYEWTRKYPDIGEALERGKAPVDFEVENMLHRNAIGYYYEETKTVIKLDENGNQKPHVEKLKKYSKPETAAQIMWLTNRKPEVWQKQTQQKNAKDVAETEKFLSETDKNRDSNFEALLKQMGQPNGEGE